MKRRTPRKPGNARGRKWTGPANLSAAAKKRHSERRRVNAICARIGRDEWNRRERERGKRRRKTEDPNIAAHRKARLRQKFGVMEARRAPYEIGTCGVSLDQLRRPTLLYIDHHGNVREEDWRSAEQLIRDYQRQRKDTSK